MIKATVYNAVGEKISDMDLSERIFGVKPVQTLIHQLIVAELANKRNTVAHTKTRGNVRGGGRKPWRQKGTGRARVGSIRSPLWRGGGIIFGPTKSRNFSKKVNKFQFRKGLFMVLSDLLARKNLFIVSDKLVTEIKTKKLAEAIKIFSQKVKLSGKVNLVIAKPDINIERSARNLAGVKVLKVSEITPYQLLTSNATIIMKDAVPVIERTYGNKRHE